MTGDGPEHDDAAGRGPASGTRQAFQAEHAEQAASWWQLIGMFVKLGVVAFGGPVAHIAMMDKEVVERRRWVDRRHFLDLMAATNLLPGPNSTQMTMHIGYVQRGDPGVFVAGSAFILPAAAITLAVAWAYVAFRELPVMDAVFYGIQPVVLAIIVMAMVRLAAKAADERKTRAVFVAALALGLLGVNELLVLALGAFAGMVLYRWRPWARFGAGALLPALPGIADAPSPQPTTELVGQLAWLFFKFGITLLGSGYLLVAYLQAALVERYALLTTPQLI